MDKIKELVVKIESLKSEQRFNDAIKLLETSLTRYNSDYRLYEELADIYLYKGELDKGLKSVDFSLSLNQKSATGNYLKGFILLSQDKVSEAIKYLEASNKLLSNNSEVLRNLGWSYTMIGNSERGIAILKRALALSPNDELITEDLAMALIGAGQITEGNELLKKIGKKIIA
ncbi:tetratricopeptide repeat protein [Candidatus Gracilibacteria bacterium]|nr:tetratricopeptide repeat protein [Candidatus Gracilibacteria bacterium]